MEPETWPNDTSQELAGDLLRGADEIAEFIFGPQASRRKVYYLAETSRLPVFRLGSTLCARRSVLLRWINGQETRARPTGLTTKRFQATSGSRVTRLSLPLVRTFITSRRR